MIGASETVSNHQPGGIPYLESAAVEQIRAAVCAGLKIPHGRESEGAGLLVMTAGSVVDGIQSVRSTYRFGRGYQLSNDDVETFDSAVQTLPHDQRCVGFFRTAHDDFKLTPDDLTLAEIVPNCRLIVLVKPFSDDRCTLRLFRPGPVVGSWSPYDQFEAPLTGRETADPPSFQDPRLESPIEPRAQQHPAFPPLPQRERFHPAAALTVPAPRAPLEPTGLPPWLPQESPRDLDGWQNSIRVPVILTSCSAVVLLLTAALVWKNLPQRRIERISTSNLGLRVEAQGNLLHLSWNRSAPEIQRAKSARVLIEDGSRRREVDLEGSDIAAGSVSYPPVSNSVRFELEILDTDPPVSEHIWVLDGIRSAGATDPAAATNVVPLGAGYTPLERPRHRWEAQPSGSEDRLRNTAADDSTTAISQMVRKTREAAARVFVPPPRSTPAKAPAADLDPPAIVAIKSEPPSIPALTVPAAPPPRRFVAQAPKLAEARVRTAPTLTVVPAKPIRQSTPHIRGLGLPAFSRDTSVQIRVVIDAKGLVERADVEKASPGTPQGLIQASLDAAREWRFQPATSGGRPVQSDHIVVFNFKAPN